MSNRAKGSAYTPGAQRQALLDSEKADVRERHGLNSQEPLIAVALSGGGVRSATISLGFLEELSRRQLLQHVDYLSSVSGGGYASGYLYSAAEAFRGSSHEQLFGPAAKREMLATGRYLAFGSGWQSSFRFARLLGSYVSTLLLNLLWMIALLVTASLIAGLCGSSAVTALHVGVVVALAAPLLRLTVLSAAAAIGGTTQILVGKSINLFEGCALLLALTVVTLFGVAPAVVSATEHTLIWLFAFVGPASSSPLSLLGQLSIATRLEVAAGSLALAIAIGFLVSSDAIGLYGVFRNLLDSAYLNAGHRASAESAQRDRPQAAAGHALRGLGKRLRVQARRRLRLSDLTRYEYHHKLPYPLFNAAAYVHRDSSADAADRRNGPSSPEQPTPDPQQVRRTGNRSTDYFLFSPKWCGAKSTGYVHLGQGDGDYDRLALADAVTCSAASLTPQMHGDTNVFVALAFLLVNLNLATWLPNPNPQVRSWLPGFWPGRYLKLILGALPANSPVVAVADGAFVDNLGVIELLRRRCNLIVCLDATLDPKYEFAHLRNLIVRARNEERLAIELPADAMNRVKPSALTGFAQSQVVVATVRDVDDVAWQGRLVYVKACLTQPLSEDGAAGVEPDGVEYQAYHPQFPQESTADQFFDPPQWHAYNELGRQLGRAIFAQAEAALAGLTTRQTSRQVD